MVCCGAENRFKSKVWQICLPIHLPKLSINEYIYIQYPWKSFKFIVHRHLIFAVECMFTFYTMHSEKIWFQKVAKISYCIGNCFHIRNIRGLCLWNDLKHFKACIFCHRYLLFCIPEKILKIFEAFWKNISSSIVFLNSVELATLNFCNQSCLLCDDKPAGG